MGTQQRRMQEIDNQIAALKEELRLLRQNGGRFHFDHMADSDYDQDSDSSLLYQINMLYEQKKFIQEASRMRYDKDAVQEGSLVRIDMDGEEMEIHVVQMMGQQQDDSEVMAATLQSPVVVSILGEKKGFEGECLINGRKVHVKILQVSNE